MCHWRTSAYAAPPPAAEKCVFCAYRGAARRVEGCTSIRRAVFDFFATCTCSLCELGCQERAKRLEWTLGDRIRTEGKPSYARPTVEATAGTSRSLLEFDHRPNEKSGGWWTQAGSNRRPRHCERRALPAELWAPIRQKLPANSVEYLA